MIAASDPQVTEAVRMFRSRIINALVGCVVGLLFVVLGGAAEWKLPIALAVIMTVLGLALTPADFRRVVVFPRGVAIGLSNLIVISPLLAFAVAEAYALDPALAVGLVILGAAPGGTMANMLTHLARGDTALSITLTAISSVAAVITVPLYLELATNHFGAGGSYRHGGRVRDVLRADDHRPAADPLPVEVHGLLEFARGVDAGWAGAGHQACGAGAFTGAGGQHDRAGVDGPEALRADGGQGQRARPVEGGHPGAHNRSGAGRRAGEPSGVRGPGQRVQPGTESAVRTVPGDSSGLLFPIQHLDPAHAGGGQAGGGRQSGGACAHDQDGHGPALQARRGVSVRHVRAPSNNARIAAPQ